MEDKTVRIMMESNDDGETCDIVLENVSAISAIYKAAQLVTAVAKQFSKDEKHMPLLVNAMMLVVHDQCKSATIDIKSKEVLTHNQQLS